MPAWLGSVSVDCAEVRAFNVEVPCERSLSRWGAVCALILPKASELSPSIEIATTMRERGLGGVLASRATDCSALPSEFVEFAEDTTGVACGRLTYKMATIPARIVSVAKATKNFAAEDEPAVGDFGMIHSDPKGLVILGDADFLPASTGLRWASVAKYDQAL